MATSPVEGPETPNAQAGPTCGALATTAAALRPFDLGTRLPANGRLLTLLNVGQQQLAIECSLLSIGQGIELILYSQAGPNDNYCCRLFLSSKLAEALYSAAENRLSCPGLSLGSGLQLEAQVMRQQLQLVLVSAVRAPLSGGQKLMSYAQASSWQLTGRQNTPLT